MKEKIVLLTGGTSGIGKQTAICLAKLGFRVIVTGRNEQAGKIAIEEIKQLSNNPNIDGLYSDISTKNGIESLVQQFKAKYDTLDVLINNAGMAASKKTLTTEGVESNFAMNVLAPYRLTYALLSFLQKSASARVITLMGGSLSSKIDLGNLQAENKFDGLNSYSHSKMAMLALMYELSERLTIKNITVNMCYPGQASTTMTQNVSAEMFPFLVRPLFPIFRYFTRPDNGKSAMKAARSSVYLVTSTEVKGKTGLYFDKNVKQKPIPKAAANLENRHYIWEYVQKLA